MDYLFYYGSQMAKAMAYALPLSVLLRFLWYLKTRRFNIWHEIAWILLFLWVFGLLSQTVFPRTFLSDAPEEQMFFINIVPFRFVGTYFNQQNTTLDFIGNIGIFIPIGFLLPLTFRVGAKSVWMSAVLSLIIELLQLFSPRVTDINDILFNTCGAVIGYLIYAFIHHYAPAFCDKFKTTPRI